MGSDDTTSSSAPLTNKTICSAKAIAESGASPAVLHDYAVSKLIVPLSFEEIDVVESAEAKKRVMPIDATEFLRQTEMGLGNGVSQVLSNRQFMKQKKCDSSLCG